MSLLINESYASSSTPLWASSSGGIITGDLDVSGTLSAPEFDVALANGTPVGARMTGSGSVDGIMYLQATQIKFARLSELGNTTFTPSATGSNLDNLTVGGIVSTRKLGMLSTTGAATCGRVVLSGGSANVLSTAVTANSLIFLSRENRNGSTAFGFLEVGPITPGVSFGITSFDSTITLVATDESTVFWMIIN